MIICPNCKQTLDKDTYWSNNYHKNPDSGICKLCGYEGHWISFFFHND